MTVYEINDEIFSFMVKLWYFMGTPDMHVIKETC